VQHTTAGLPASGDKCECVFERNKTAAKSRAGLQETTVGRSVGALAIIIANSTGQRGSANNGGNDISARENRPLTDGRRLTDW
jgi:hypothetical protein